MRLKPPFRSTLSPLPVTVALLSLLLATGPPSLVAAHGKTSDPPPDLSRFYAQGIDWVECRSPDMPDDMRCGTVTVPLDYARPGAGSLKLALARQRATGPSRGSLLLNFGGPGGSGVSALAVSSDAFMHLTKGYDVVSFDPRGVGRSSPVSCGPASARILEATAGDAELDDPEDTMRRLRSATAECERHSGPVLPHVGTVNAARDLDVIRAALGHDKLDYLGFSYGTRLGAVYAKRFPDRVGRMVLDGVDTLTESLAEQGLTGARGQQRALEHFLTWCVREVGCAFGRDAREARRQVVRLVEALDEDPLTTTFGGRFTGQDLVGALGQALYGRELWPLLSRALAHLIERGDPSALEGFVPGGVALPGRVDPGNDGELTEPEEIPRDNLPAALMAINCADDPDRPSAERVARSLDGLRDRYRKASPVFGPYRLAQVLMCHGRPRGTDYIREEVKDLDTPPMLLVGTRGDPATPYRWTVQTARRLGPSAVVLDNRGEGHTGYFSSECVHRKVDDFLLYGSLPPDGSSCGTPEAAEDGSGDGA
ncbi:MULTISPECIES: alpha/beta hydrolase [unclassified Streptomyces]|uniref:alpha/beta hydrolase n=1 Tax=unclassified Streptomyces TaxID=2593676 RepID=UPI001905037D|nr:alpha/beta hydrolase [Streptomyces sp. HSG2]